MLEMPTLRPFPSARKGIIHDVRRVAFMGAMCSGKTYCANHLEQGWGYKKLGFADKLKAVAYDLYGVQGKDGEARQVLQLLADDLKKYDPDLFIKHLLYKAKMYEDKSIVVDDLRFKSEADALRKNGFIIIKVMCKEPIRQQRVAALYPSTPQAAQEHISEQQWTRIRYDKFIVSEDIGAIFDIDKILGLE